MAKFKEVGAFLSSVDSIQLRFLQSVVERQNEESLKKAEEQRDSESPGKLNHSIDSQQGTS